MRARRSQRITAFACAALAGTLGLGLGLALDSGARAAEAWDRYENEPTAHELQLARTMLEQTRAYQLSRGLPASAIPPALDARAPRPLAEDGPALLARITGRRLAQPEQEATRPAAEQLFLQGIANNYARLTAGIGCCPCATSATCTDHVFCNGAETCQNSICAGGSPPCVDGDACTTDQCLEGLSTCIFNPVPPPAEVAQLDLSLVSPGSTTAKLRWTDVPGAADYNVYRGEKYDLGDLSCFIPHITGTRAEDDGAVSTEALFYLVTAFACGESTLGSAHPGTRPPPPGCP